MFGETAIPSGLGQLSMEQDISSQLKGTFCGTNNSRDHPLYNHDWTDADGIHCIQFKQIKDVMMTTISREELSTILNFGTTAGGCLASPSFITGGKRDDFIRNVLKNIRKLLNTQFFFNTNPLTLQPRQPTSNWRNLMIDKTKQIKETHRTA